jgi:hypothetical protein
VDRGDILFVQRPAPDAEIIDQQILEDRSVTAGAVLADVDVEGGIGAAILGDADGIEPQAGERAWSSPGLASDTLFLSG